MPIGGKVDTLIKKLMSRGLAEGNAIAILKAKKVLKQKGKHVVMSKTGKA